MSRASASQAMMIRSRTWRAQSDRSTRQVVRHWSMSSRADEKLYWLLSPAITLYVAPSGRPAPLRISCLNVGYVVEGGVGLNGLASWSLGMFMIMPGSDGTLSNGFGETTGASAPVSVSASGSVVF